MNSDSNLADKIKRKFHGNVGMAIFVTFQSIYGNKFTSIYSNEKMGQAFVDEWNEQLNGLPLFKIKQACDRCRDPFGLYAEFAPTVAQFKRMCLLNDEELNIPSLDDAYNDFLFRPTNDNPFAQLIAQKLKKHILKNLPEKEAKKQFEPVYKTAKEQILRQQTILPKVERYKDAPKIECRKQTEEEERAMRALAEKNLNDLRKMLGVRQVKYD